MEIIPEPLEFEWDKGNKDKNVHKHKVANQEAEEVFGNEPLVMAEDKKHSKHEQRYQALGKTNKGREMFLSFTVRENKVRVISIRDMNKKEEIQYEKF